MAPRADELHEALAEAQRIAHVGNWEWVVGSNRVTWSDELYRIYGLAPGAITITYEEYMSRVHPDDRTRVGDAIAAALRRGGEFAFEERIVRPGGEIRVLASRGEVHSDERGAPERLVGVCHDVTEQRAAERRLEHAEGEARVAARLRALQSVADAALAHLTLDDLLETLLDRISGVLDVDNAAILLADGAGSALELRSAKGFEAQADGVRIPFGKGFAGRVATERQPVALVEGIDREVLNPILREAGLQSLLGVPLIAGEEVVGVLHVGSLAPRRFGTDEIDLLELAAQRAALAISHARIYERERGVAEMLQRSLLPQSLPAVPGLRVAARYLPSAEAASVGGDWYDVLALDGRRAMLVLGDVVGHGIAAASLMSRMRNGVEAYAREGHGVASVLELVDRMVSPAVPDFLATMLVAELVPGMRRLEVASAGHLPPLLLDATGGARYAEPLGGPPIGFRAVRSVDTVEVAAGTRLVLCSDGLVERPGESIDVGLERLRDRAASGPVEPERLADHLLATVLPGDAVRDDVALLVAALGAE